MNGAALVEFLEATGCAGLGPCDAAAERDRWIPPGQPVQVLQIPVKFNILGNDAGTEYAATPQDVDGQFEDLKNNFLASGITFIKAGGSFIPHTRFYQFCGPEKQGVCFDFQSRCSSATSSEEMDMKTLYAENPGQWLNVYVVDMDLTTGFRGVGYFPWCGDPVGVPGGVVIDNDSFGAGCGPESKACHVLGHEIGHNLGLWHTHHGVSEVPACMRNCEDTQCVACEDDPANCHACYEYATIVPPDCDTRGDFCCDTPPTPVNFECVDLTGT